MKVQLVSKLKDALVGSKLSFDVAARYLFGGSALDAASSCRARSNDRFRAEQNAELTKAAPEGQAGVARRAVARPARSRGSTRDRVPQPDENTTFTQTGELTATASVLEAGSGRATVKTASATLHPEKYYLGVRTKATRAKAARRSRSKAWSSTGPAS